MEKQKIPEELGPIQTANYYAGSVDYVVTGTPNPGRNRIMLVPGYTEGFVALGDFARALCDDNRHQVVLTDQPRAKSKNVLDVQAEAILQIIEDNGWQDEPMDFVSHSMGAIITMRAAELAKLRRWKCFDSKAGSRSIFIAPAGMYDQESIRKITPRYLKLLGQISSGDKKLDKTIANNGIKEFFDKPIQHSREALGPVIHERIVSGYLGEIGLKPTVFVYPEDPMYPHEIIAGRIIGNLQDYQGYATPIDAVNKGVKAGYEDSSFEEFKQKSGLKVGNKEQKSIYQRHYLGAGHNDLLYNARRTADAVLQLLDSTLRYKQSTTHPAGELKLG